MKSFINYSALVFIAAISSNSIAAEKPTLTVLTYDSFASDWGPGAKIKPAFEAECDCTLKFLAADSSAGILNRVQLEGKRSKVDVVLGLDSSQRAAARATELLAEHQVDTNKLSLPVDWDDSQLLPFDYGYYAFVYNKELIKEPPTSLQALAESDYKIIIQDPRSSTVGLGFLLWVQSVFGDESEAYWQALSDNVVTVTKGWSEAYGLFLKQEADFVLSYTTSPAYHIEAEQDTRFTTAQFSDGHGIQVEVAALLKNAPQPELGQQFMQFITSTGFQSAIPSGNWMYPVTDVELPNAFADLAQPKALPLLPADTVTEKRKHWLSAFSAGLTK